MFSITMINDVVSLRPQCKKSYDDKINKTDMFFVSHFYIVIYKINTYTMCLYRILSILYILYYTKDCNIRFRCTVNKKKWSEHQLGILFGKCTDYQETTAFV